MHDGDALEVVVLDELSEFFDVGGDVVELGAGDGDGPAAEELFVEVGHSEGDAVGGQHQLGIGKIRGHWRDQMELNGPLGQLRGAVGFWCVGGGFGRSSGGFVKLHRAHTGADETGVLFGRLRSGSRGSFRRVECFEILVRGGFVELGGVALFDGDGVHRAMSKTGTQSVAVGFADEFGFAVDEPDGAFGAGGDAQAAAVTFFFVDFYDVSQCHSTLTNQKAEAGLHRPASVCCCLLSNVNRLT